MDECLSPKKSRQGDAWRIAVLLLLSTAIHTWIMARSEMPARDGVVFIHYALQLESDSWTRVMEQNHQHPLYPLTLLAVSVPVRFFLGGTNCASMLLSAKLASALAGVLLVIPMYYLGRALFDRRIGFWSAALFQCLPVSARILGDTLSDPLCLFLVAMALWLGVEGLQGRWWVAFAGCGVFGGLAYLTRPEGLLPALATGLVLVGGQTMAGLAPAGSRRAARCWPWGRLALCALSLAVAVAAVGGPFIAVTRHLSSKPTTQAILKSACVSPPGKPSGSPKFLFAISWMPPGPSGGPSAVWGLPDSEHKPPLTWGLYALVRETIRAFNYFVWLPVVAGLFLFRDQWRKRPELWLVGLTAGLLGVFLVRMGVIAGYVSERHVQILVLCGSYWGIAGMAAGGDWLVRRGRRITAPVLLILLIFSGLPALARPLHANHAGYRLAGEWLARNTAPGDKVIDPDLWAYFFGGGLFPSATGPGPHGNPRSFVVVESPKRVTFPRGMEGPISYARKVGTVVFRCPMDPGKTRGPEVVVFSAPCDPNAVNYSVRR